MHTIKLHVEDNVYQKVMTLLSNLKLKGFKIEEPKKDEPLDFSNYTVKAFKEIKDPVQWQRNIRDEWN